MPGGEVGRAFIRLMSDASGLRRQVEDDTKKATAGVKAEVPLDVDDEAAKAKFKAFKSELDALGKRGDKVKIDADDKQGRATLLAFQAALLKLSAKKVDPKIDPTGFAAAQAQVAALDVALDRLDHKRTTVHIDQAALRNATGTWATLTAAALAFGPAALPVLGAVTGAVLGLSAALGGAAAGLGVFGVAVTSNLTELQKQLTKVKTANASAAVAEQTAAKNRTKSQKQAIANAKALTAAFNKQFGAEATAIEKLKAAWLSFVTRPAVRNTIAQAADLIRASLSHLVPLLRLGARFVSAFLSIIGGFVASGGLDKLVSGLVRFGKVGLTGLLAVLHNLAVAFAALAPGAGKFAQAAVDGLVNLSRAFANWATNRGPAALTALMTVIRRFGPQVGRLLSSLAAVLPNLARGLFPLAPLSLALSTALAGLIAHVNPHVITGLAIAFLAVYSALKLSSAVISINTARINIATAATKAWAAAQWLLDAAMSANPIALAVIAIAALVAAIIYAYKHFKGFRDVVQSVWGWIRKNWPLLTMIIAGPIGVAAVLVIKHWRGIWTFVKAVWGWIKHNWPLLLAIIAGPIGVAVTLMIRHWRGLWTLLKDIWGFMKAGWRLFIAVLTGNWKAAWNALRDGWHVMQHTWHDVLGGIRTVAKLAWDYIKLAGLEAVDKILKAFSHIPFIGHYFKSAERIVSGWIGNIQDDINGLTGHNVKVGVAFAQAQTGHQGPSLSHRAAGGFIAQGTGPTADDVPIWASRGEYVVKAASVARYGTHMLDAINAGRYARGGPVRLAAGGPVDLLTASAHVHPSAGAIATMIARTIHTMATSWAKSFAASFGGSPGFGIAPNGPIQQYARRLLSAYGWGSQWGAFNALVMSESGWNPLIVNRSSGAYGIPQALPGSKMASAGADWRTNPFTQLRWMMGYIQQRYGSPAAAWAFHLAHNSYAGGTAGAAPGWAWVGEAGPELVRMRGGETVLDAATSALWGRVGRGYRLGTEARRGLTAADRWIFGSLSSLNAIHRYTRETARLVRDYYHAHARQWRLRALDRRTGAIARIARRLDRLPTLAQAHSYQRSVYSGLRDYGALTNVGTAYVGSGTNLRGFVDVAGVRQKIATVKAFGRALRRLQKLGLTRGLLRQIIAMGPDDGLTYANALISAGVGQIHALVSAERGLTRAERGLSRTATDVVYDRGARAGRGFLTGLRHERHALDAEMQRLGNVLGRQVARWFHVPANRVHTHRRHRRMARGGLLTEPVYGFGSVTGDAYDFAEHGPERVGGTGGAHVHIHGNLVVRERADVDLIAQRLAFRLDGA